MVDKMTANNGRPPTDADVLLVGGGLANSLIAIALRRRRPDLRMIMLEKRSHTDSAHTWSVFRPDLSTSAWDGLVPLFEQVWHGYEVHFPGHQRRLSTTYASLTGARLDAEVERVLGPDLRRGASVVAIASDEVRCQGGLRLRAPLVIDGRGESPSRHLQRAFQKFVGLELIVQEPHGLERPIVMDARVPQEGGFRFMYVLPFTSNRLLIEDTRYSDEPHLDSVRLEAEVLTYARQRGWTVAGKVRRESGVLPVVLGGDIEAYLAERATASVGMRGAFFHPTTGYSLPDAARIAATIADLARLRTEEVRDRLRALSIAQWRQRGFYRALNRMMFLAAAPEQRYRVLERFYRLPQPVIERFYAANSTLMDKARIVSGRPPLPISRALAAIRAPIPVDDRA